jgi:hypothetical protein
VALTIKVEAFQGPTGAPCAAVIVRTDGERDVMVSRVIDGVEAGAVRGANPLHVFESGHVVDYDVPIGILVHYRARTANEVAEVAYQATSGYGWIMDAYDPSRAFSVALKEDLNADAILLAAALESDDRAASIETVDVIGSSYPVAVGARRRRPSSIPLHLATLTKEGASIVGDVLGSSVVSVRLPPGVPSVESTAYLAIPTVNAEFPRRRHGDAAFTLWKANAAHVRPVSAPWAWETWTYERVWEIWKSAPTWQAVSTVASLIAYNLADVARDPRMGGRYG